MWQCLLSTSAGGGGGQFIVQASVRGPLLCHSVPPCVHEFLQHPYNGAQGGIDGFEFLPEPQILFLLQPLGLLKLGQYRCHCLLGMMVGSHDVGEGLVESGFPGPSVCILSAAVCTANGIPRLKDHHVDSCVVIVWAYSCWRDGVGFAIASVSLTFGVADLCNSGYPNLSWLLTPVRNPRTKVEERYNEAHGRTRRIIECTFGLLKDRLRCLHLTGGSLYYSRKKVCQIIVACCMLHNLALRRQVPLLQEDGPDVGLVAAVEPVDSEEEEAEEEDIVN
ncbi:hypothetical protein NDU88_007788 [Pleurodeles waltl]|uniref:DDE Tnp4 domain-containing protein n=1 Tax=Pleurodeles waltl TaxID=8319 RepID=A0AAV7N527_PLEWA|nr:hypothetical protein NDU88_007788 [Pleurodeles waltl]